jgi:hypothetical protein
VTGHLTDEELLLDYYGEGTSSDRARVQAHLERCLECRSVDRELRSVLSAVETTPLSEPPSDFEREMWARIEPLLPVRGAPTHDWTWMMPRMAAAAAVVVMIAAAFAAGRLWDRPAEPPALMTDDSDRAERLLRAEVGDHLERSQRVLVELVNADMATADLMTGDRARAADLVAAGRLYRRSVETIGDDEIGALLEDLERVLVELANGSPDAGPDELARLRERIAEQDLLFRVRVVTREMGW